MDTLANPARETVPRSANVTASPQARHAEQLAERGLCHYLAQIAAELELGMEAACWEVASPATAYLALDGHLPGVPDRDVALVWNSRHGWAVGVEYDTAAQLLVLGYLGGSVLPQPRAVVDFVRQALAGCGHARWYPPELSSHDLSSRLVEYAPPPAT